jgi:membrane protein CcdC involved in cytochrome C biogenesis
MSEILDNEVVRWILKIVGYLAIPLTILSVVWMIKTLRRPKPVTFLSLVVQIVLPVLVLLVYSLLLHVSVNPVLAWPLFAAGLVLGVISGQTTKLNVKKGKVYGQRSVWYLVVWAVTFSVTQLLSLLQRRGIVAIGLATMYFSTGLAIGTNVSFMYRRWRLLSKEPKPVPVPAVAHHPKAGGVVTCPNCSTPNTGARKFCRDCGKPLVVRAAPAPAARKSPGVCPNCGRPNPQGRQFCAECGQKLIQ